MSEMETEILKYFTRGLTQIPGHSVEKKHGETEDKSQPSTLTDRFILHLYSQNNRKLQKLSTTKAQNSRTEEVNYAPLKFGLRIAEEKYRELLPEFLHLCEKHNLKIHPAQIPALLNRRRDFRERAKIYRLLPPVTKNALERWFTTFPFGKKGTGEIENLTGVETKTLAFYKMKTEEKSQFAQWLEGMWQKLNTQNRLAVLEVLPPGLFSHIPHRLEEDFPYTSKRINRLLLALDLSGGKSGRAKLFAENLAALLSAGKTEPQEEIEALCKACKADNQEELLLTFSRAIPPSSWLSKADFPKLTAEDGSFDQEDLQNIFYAGLWSQNQELIEFFSRHYQELGAFKSLFSDMEQPFELRINPVFFNQLSKLFLSSPNPVNLSRFELLMTKYHGFLPDNTGSTLLNRLADLENPIFESSTGMSTVKSIMRTLQNKANPMLLNTLEKHGMSGGKNHYILAWEIMVAERIWTLRKNMRLSFAKAAKTQQI